MAKNANNNIKIHFRAEGEKELRNAITALANSTRSLKRSQVQLAKATGAYDKAQKSAIQTGVLAHRNQRNMNQAVKEGSMTFSVFRSKLLLASFAVGLMGGSIGRLVSAFAEQESSEKRIDAALKSTGNISGLTGKQIKAMTREMEQVGVVGDEVNNKMAAVLLTFTNIRGQAFERTMKAANNMAISLSGGIPNFEQLRGAAIQLGKALQDPAGQLGALSRSGFTFTGSQKEMIKELVKSNKLFEAQSIILDAAETQFGGLSDEMAKTAQGAFKQLSMQMGSFAEVLGKEVTPGSKEFAISMKELFVELEKNVDKLMILALTIRDTAVAIGIYKVGMKTAIFLQRTFNAGLTTTIIRQAAVTVGLSIFAATAAMAHMRQRMQNAELEESDDLWAGYGSSVSEATIDLTQATKKLEESTQNLKLQQELAIANINLENAALLQLTDQEVKSFKEKKRQLMITQELLKIDATKREGMKAEVVTFVNLKISYQEYLAKFKEHIAALKEAEKAASALKKMEDARLTATREAVINTAKITILQSEKSKKEKQASLDNIDMLAELDARMVAATGKGLELQTFFEAGFGINEVRDVMFQTNDEFDVMVQRMIEAITTGKDLDKIMKEFTESLKAIKQEDPFLTFEERANMALNSFSNFSSSYNSLVEERMNREIEALKSTRAFEDASQEEREVMENRIQQKFRSQRKKAFRMNKASSIATASMNTYEGVTKALASKNFPLAALISALGFAQVAAIAAQPAPRFATGGSFITNGPQNMLVGESGAEKVTIQPLSGGTSQNTTNNRSININVTAPLVDETIIDVLIPKIEEAVRLDL